MANVSARCVRTFSSFDEVSFSDVVPPVTPAVRKASSCKYRGISVCHTREDAEISFNIAMERIGRVSVSSSIESELRLLEGSALSGFAPAQYELAKLYAAGRCGHEFVTTPRLLMLSAAGRNYVEAMYLLGDWCFRGYQVERSPEDAVFWWKEASKLGCGVAFFRLWECFFHGWGVSRSYETAIQKLVRAAELQYPRAECAVRYEYQQLAEGGNRPHLSQQNYRRLALAATGMYPVRTAKRSVRKRQLTRNRCSLVERKAAYANRSELGHEQKMGRMPYTRTRSGAAKTRKNSAEANYQAAMALMRSAAPGNKYCKAFQLAMKAAKAGHAKAQMLLGKFFLYGWGIGAPNQKAALDWFLKARDVGITEAANFISEIQEGITAKQKFQAERRANEQAQHAREAQVPKPSNRRELPEVFKEQQRQAEVFDGAEWRESIVREVAKGYPRAKASQYIRIGLGYGEHSSCFGKNGGNGRALSGRLPRPDEYFELSSGKM